LARKVQSLGIEHGQFSTAYWICNYCGRARGCDISAKLTPRLRSLGAQRHACGTMTHKFHFFENQNRCRLLSLRGKRGKAGKRDVKIAVRHRNQTSQKERKNPLRNISYVEYCAAQQDTAAPVKVLLIVVTFNLLLT
jgi:hypothetical protein